MLSFSSLLSDTKNFIINNLLPIMITVIGLAIISQIIIFYFYPSIESFAPIKQLIEQAMQQENRQLSPEVLSRTMQGLSEPELQRLISALMDYLIRAGSVFLLINLLSMSAILSLIYMISYQAISLSNLLKGMSRVAIKIILYMLLAIPVFFVLSLIVSVIPVLAMPLIIIVAVLYILTYITFLAVIIVPTQQSGFLKQLKKAFLLLKQKITLIMPISIIWVLVMFLLNNLMAQLTANIFILIIFDAIKLLLTLVTLCYLYRLYSLSNKDSTHDACN